MRLLKLEINLFNISYHNLIIVIATWLAVIAELLIQPCTSQFISHINQRGLRGNITFNVREDANETLLVIDALLEEVDQSRWLQGARDEDEFDSSQPILFDWSIHTNTLEPQMISSCSNDDLGAPLADLQKLLFTTDKPIALDKQNHWTLPLSEVLRTSSAKSLSSLIWGRSIRLRLSSVHGGGSGSSASGQTSTQQQTSSSSSDPVQQQQAASQPQRPKGSTFKQPARTGSSVLSRPQLTASTPAPAGGAAQYSGKPTFAPRPKPSLSRPKAAQPSPPAAAAAPSLPKPEALIAESPTSQENTPGVAVASAHGQLATNTSSSTTSASISTSSTTQAPAITREMILEATHKRIARLYGNLIVCGNIIETRAVKTVEAVFESQHIGGKVTIRGNEDDTTLLMLNLYHIRSKVTTRHDWLIMASDILDNRREDEKCKYLQLVFDPNNNAEQQQHPDGTVAVKSTCGRNDTSKCRMGDLTRKHGQVQVAGQGRRTRTTLVDANLPLSALEGSRSLFLVVHEVANKLSANGLPSRPAILSCAPIRSQAPRRVEAAINMDGVRGYVRVSQRHPSEPAQISYDIFGLEGNVRHQTIRELPLATAMRPAAGHSADNSSPRLCSQLGAIFDPTKVVMAAAASRQQTNTLDSFPVGNLSAKHGPLLVIDSEYEDHYMGEHTDLNLQLFGLHSIVGRSLVLHKNNGDPWVCATLNYVTSAGATADKQQPTISLAVATFHYPVVGQIFFSQLAGEPYAETSVHVELYNPNGDIKASQSQNTDDDSRRQSSSSGDETAAQHEAAPVQPTHNWLIHLRPALADFYNWSARCESAGEVYDPNLSSVGLSSEVYARQCKAGLAAGEPLRCRTGDTSLKSGFKLALPAEPERRTRYFYTDLHLPLAGLNSIIGRSVVIYDESAPVQRGPRLACSNIQLVHALRASVKSWDSGPSIPSAVRGSASFEQESAGKATRVRLELSGFSGNVEHYAVHQVWTTDDREFPCSNDSLYDIYDPHDNEHWAQRLPPSAHYGASAPTVDRVKVGDLSRKHGTLEGLQSVAKSYVDANLPLFAPHSIIGRSLVLRAAVNDFRWVCGNVELDYDKSSSRELIGIASFDDARARISGYVRFTQLEHKDGSTSDTFIQVDLRNQALPSDLPSTVVGGGGGGVSSPIELKTSENHNWAVFVNQVGEDAFIAADEVRCIAAGFKWNPYLAQDARDSYATSACTPSEQLGCAMGDLGMRHGPLTLGSNNRRTLSDSNLPLVGNYSVMGRSLVIFDNKRPNIKLACANILPDIHLKSNVVIKRTPTFTVARFVEQMRLLLGASDWLMVPELRATKPVANGECVQMTIHFYGQRAHQMQVELNNLITLGTVRKSSRFGPEKISTHYKLCRAGQAQLTSGATSHLNPPRAPIEVCTLLFATLIAQAVCYLIFCSKFVSG